MVRTVKTVKVKRRRLLIILVAIFLFAWLAIVAYKMLFTTQSAQQNVAVPVAAEVSEAAPLVDGASGAQVGVLSAIAAEGELVPLRSAELSFTVSGLVSDLLVHEGDTVALGQAMVRLSSTDLAASVAQAEAGIRQAQASLQAVQSQLLMAQTHAEVTAAQLRAAQAGVRVSEAQFVSARAGVQASVAEAPVVITQAEASYTEAEARVTQAQANVAQAQAGDAEARAAIGQVQAMLAEAQAAVAQAEAAYQSAQASLDKTVLSAPFAGKVASLEVELGEAVGPSSPVLHLADFDAWLVETTDLTEIDVVDLELGQPVKVSLDALPDQTFAGSISKIANVSVMKRGDVTYDVTVALEDTRDWPLRWGMTAFVDFNAP